MKTAKPKKEKELKSKMIKIYFDKKSIFIRPTKRSGGRHVILKHIKEDNIGKALTFSASDAEIGRNIREQYENCT